MCSGACSGVEGKGWCTYSLAGGMAAVVLCCLVVAVSDNDGAQVGGLAEAVEGKGGGVKGGEGEVCSCFCGIGGHGGGLLVFVVSG